MVIQKRFKLKHILLFVVLIIIFLFVNQIIKQIENKNIFSSICINNMISNQIRNIGCEDSKMIDFNPFNLSYHNGSIYHTGSDNQLLILQDLIGGSSLNIGGDLFPRTFDYATGHVLYFQYKNIYLGAFNDNYIDDLKYYENDNSLWFINFSNNQRIYFNLYILDKISDKLYYYVINAQSDTIVADDVKFNIPNNEVYFYKNSQMIKTFKINTASLHLIDNASF